MPKKCRHRNGSFFEILYAYHVRDVSDAKMDKIGNNEMGDISEYEFKCSDCGGSFKLKFPVGENPKWLQDLYKQL